MRFTFPWPPTELNPNKRVHWAKKAKAARAYRDRCYILARKVKMEVEEGRLHLFITFYPPDKRRRDDDNCFASFKAGRDGLAQAMGVDDVRFVTHPYLSDTVVKGGLVRVTITSNPAGDSDE